MQTKLLNNTADRVLDPNLVSTYNALIQNVLNKSGRVNLILKERIILSQNGEPNGALGACGLAVSNNNGVVNVDITLDPNQLASGSQEFVAAAIYHECFHAIVNCLTDNSYSGAYQHEAMFNQYLDLLANGLEQAYPTLTQHPGDAKSLILYGLLALEGGDNPNNGKWPTGLVDSILSVSQFSRTQILSTFLKYQVYKTVGTLCN